MVKAELNDGQLRQKCTGDHRMIIERSEEDHGKQNRSMEMAVSLGDLSTEVYPADAET